MAPPSTPGQALALSTNLHDLVTDLDPAKAAATLAALMTDPRFQAHTVRLDYGLRLVLSTGCGKRKLRRAGLSELLNRSLVEARVDRLEDPIEDFFIEAIPTRHGDYLIFSGIWEKAAAHTECVLQAFTALPEWAAKDQALLTTYSLLALSDALARRCGLGRRAIGENSRANGIIVPSEERLQLLSQRVRFTWGALSKLGIKRETLLPFGLSMEAATSLADSVQGDSALEFQPLILTEDDLLVAAPANISTAARAWMIDVAIKGGQGAALRNKLLEVQAELVRESGFVRLAGMEHVPGTPGSMRQSLFEEFAGRYIHIIQTIADFAGWPHCAFGEPKPYSKEWALSFVHSMRTAKQFAERQDGFVEGMTVWLIGGWGSGYNVSLDLGSEFSDWPLIDIEPADAAVLRVNEDGKVSDLWRLHKQLALVKEQGFEFHGVNGPLNLFQWWRNTEYALIPPHMVDATPPLMVNFGTDLLLQVRREGHDALDRRAVLHPDGSHHVVARLNHEALGGEQDPIYVSYDALRDRRLVGVVISDGTMWWVELLDEGEQDYSKPSYKIWEALLYWARIVMPPFLATLKARDIRPPILIKLEISWDDIVRERNLSDKEIADSVEVAVDPERKFIRLIIRSDWHWVVRRADNKAEWLLASRLLLGVTRLLGIERPQQDLEASASQAAGSLDFRWVHSFEARTALEVLAAKNLISPFYPIPRSAGGLVKCGAVWITRARDLGSQVEGKEQCVRFLTDHGQTLFGRLRTEVRRYNRKTLIVMVLNDMQAALNELRQWRMTARALRAAHGVQGDFQASLARAKQANGVIRAATILAEVASAEAPEDGGLRVGRMDMEELQARSLMLFTAGNVLAAIHGDRIEARFNISPTGDLLYDHRFEELTIQRGAEAQHELARRHASREYSEYFETQQQSRELEAPLQVAVRAEYGVEHDVFVQIRSAAAQFAILQGTGVMVLRRSELIGSLGAIEMMVGKELAPLIDRMTLPARAGWDDLPPGTSIADFDLAKFDRRYSLIARPIVALSAGQDPELVFAPALVERAIVYNIGGALSGALQNEYWQSNAMRKFASTAGSEFGIAFNKRVAESLSKLGLCAWPSAKPSWCLNQKATDQLKALGDIDVLAVSHDEPCVWVVEAKDLKMCRTLGEAARRLSEYQGKLTKKGKPDKLLRHLQRVAYIRNHASDLCGRLDLKTIPKVCGLVVIDAPQPMEQMTNDVGVDGGFVTLTDIERVPWVTGWQT